MLLVLLFGVIYITLCFIAHALYRGPLWDYSVEFIIPTLQTAPTWVIESFAWSFWFLDEGVYMWMMGFFAFFNRASSLYLFFSASVLGWISELLMVYFHDGRPFYMIPGESVEGYNCEDINFG